jgi:hypothetical protein
MDYVRGNRPRLSGGATLRSVWLPASKASQALLEGTAKGRCPLVAVKPSR